MRNPDSHKGENGIVAVVGGSRFQHGAPLFSALAAEASGVDLIHVYVPFAHAEAAKQASLNFQVHTFGSVSDDKISASDRALISELLATMDSAVIGPGLSRSEESIASIMTLLEGSSCPLVVDASALQPMTIAMLSGKGAVVTPHLGELERMGIEFDDVPSVAKSSGCTFLVKSLEDTIVADDGTEMISKGGNAGLTVGGTGDALAGLTAGLIAQGHPPQVAARLASTAIKKAGEILFEDYGFAYTTQDVIECLPMILKDLLS